MLINSFLIGSVIERSSRPKRVGDDSGGHPALRELLLVHSDPGDQFASRIPTDPAAAEFAATAAATPLSQILHMPFWFLGSGIQICSTCVFKGYVFDLFGTFRVLFLVVFELVGFCFAKARRL